MSRRAKHERSFWRNSPILTFLHANGQQKIKTLLKGIKANFLLLTFAIAAYIYSVSVLPFADQTQMPDIKKIIYIYNPNKIQLIAGNSRSMSLRLELVGMQFDLSFLCVLAMYFFLCFFFFFNYAM